MCLLFLTDKILKDFDEGALTEIILYGCKKLFLVEVKDTN